LTPLFILDDPGGHFGWIRPCKKERLKSDIRIGIRIHP
jgi:hypothetical protein